MSYRLYVIRNRDNMAWLTQVYQEKGLRTFRYLPDISRAMRYDSLHEAQKMAKECRGKIQILRMTRGGKAYAEDMK